MEIDITNKIKQISNLSNESKELKTIGSEQF